MSLDSGQIGLLLKYSWFYVYRHESIFARLVILAKDFSLFNQMGFYCNSLHNKLFFFNEFHTICQSKMSNISSKSTEFLWIFVCFVDLSVYQRRWAIWRSHCPKKKKPHILAEEIFYNTILGFIQISFWILYEHLYKFNEAFNNKNSSFAN